MSDQTCECGHRLGAHLTRRGNLPPYCSKCKAPQAGHSFKERVK